jgi:hypothetical protein
LENSAPEAHEPKVNPAGKLGPGGLILVHGMERALILQHPGRPRDFIKRRKATHDEVFMKSTAYAGPPRASTECQA